MTPEEYYEIEQIYNTVDTIDKKEFCEHWKRGNYMYLLAQLVKKVRDYEKWVDDNEKWAKEQSETKNACIPVLLDKADSYGDYKLKEVAISLAGVRTTAKMCGARLQALRRREGVPPRHDRRRRNDTKYRQYGRLTNQTNNAI